MSATTNYVSTFGWYRIKTKNFIHNRLFPVHPGCVAATQIGIGAAIYAAFNGRSNSNAEFSVKRLLQSFTASFLICYICVLLIRLFLRRYVFGYTNWIFDNRSKVSWRTKIWMGFVKLVSMRRPILHSYDQALMPSLPLPTLTKTVRRYLDSIKPLYDSDEHKRIAQLAAEFENSEGRTLHRYVWVKSCLKRNWVTDWWEKYAYLYSRKPTLINSNVCNIDLFSPLKACPAARAANLLHLDVQHMLQVEYETFPALITMGVPLTAQWYDRAYSTCRIPGENIDTRQHWSDSRHVAVFRQGCWYKLTVADNDNQVLPAAELEKCIQLILDRTPDPSPGEQHLNALSMTDRTKWAKNRQRFLTSNAINRQSLHVIESCITAVFFPAQDVFAEYGDLNEDKVEKQMKLMLAGDGVHQWPDKSYSYIIGHNGRAGGNVEHSWGDGFEFDHMAELLRDKDSKQGYTEDGHSRGKCRPDFNPHAFVERLKWDLDENVCCVFTSFLSAPRNKCRNEIHVAHREAVANVDNLDLASLVFTDYGKGLIKKCNVSPDAWFQMALQLAYFRDQNEFTLTYEAASARFYAEGRTETYRVVTEDSCKFVRAMQSDSDADKSEKIALLRQASSRHTYGNRLAMTGRGVDRHLFAMYVLAKGLGHKSAFLDFVFDQPWTLSTSQAPQVTNLTDENKQRNFSWLGASFGPVADRGYGVCYRMAGDHSICAHVTAFNDADNTDAHRFRDRIRTALLEFRALFDDV